MRCASTSNAPPPARPRRASARAASRRPASPKDHAAPRARSTSASSAGHHSVPRAPQVAQARQHSASWRSCAFVGSSWAVPGPPHLRGPRGADILFFTEPVARARPVGPHIASYVGFTCSQKEIPRSHLCPACSAWPRPLRLRNGIAACSCASPKQASPPIRPTRATNTGLAWNEAGAAAAARARPWLLGLRR